MKRPIPAPQPRRILWIDGSAGAAGDMLLGMWVDLGLPFAQLKRQLAALDLPGWTMRSRRVDRCGVAARKIDVRVVGESDHGRGWKSLSGILRRSSLDAPVKRNALAIFKRLLEAEARAHGLPFERVHLHEAGGIDAIVDVVGSCIAINALAIDEIVVSPLTTGFGRVHCTHGDYPVPGPATMNLLEGIPIRGGEIESERLTPTAAAILTTVADRWGAAPAMRPITSGNGAGSKNFDAAPNVVRGLLGETFELGAVAASEDDPSSVIVIECAIDDMTPQALSWTLERLLKIGALDATISPTLMKKGRPGHLLSVLGRPAQAQELLDCIFRESSTLGVRYRTERRVELQREHRRVRTEWGLVTVKIGRWQGEIVQAWPEYEDFAKFAERKKIPLIQVQEAALFAFNQRRKR